MRLLTIILLLISFQLFAQKTKSVEKKLGKYEYETFSTIKEKGKPIYRQGEYKRFKYRRLVEGGTYEQGKKDGKWINYASDGYQEYFYTMGQLDSFYGNKGQDVVGIRYNENGREVSKYYFSSPNKNITTPIKDGIQLIRLANNGFIENDTIALGTIVDEEMHGDWLYKNSDGSNCKLHFDKGNLVGKQNSFHYNGSPYSTLHYNDSSKLEGPYFIQYQNGDTLFYQNYINGKQHGYGTAKYKNGKTYYTATYNLGKLQSFNEQNIAGIAIQKSKIEDGTGQLMEYYWVDGQIKVSTVTTYADGLPNGMRFHFQGDTVTYSEKYENGLFVGYGKEPNYKINREELDTLFPKIDFDIVDTTKRIKSHFAGGEDGLQRFLAENITYPPMALENDVSGQVVLSFVVDRLGNIKNVKTVSKTLGFGMEEESIRVIQATSELWTPAIYFGIPVKMRFRIPVKYQIF